VRSEQDSLLRLGLLGNRPLLAAVSITMALQLAIIYVPWLNRLFGTEPLGAAQLGLTLAAALCVLGAVEIEKAVRRHLP
jgi:Ca2+-transporting ATPase